MARAFSAQRSRGAPPFHDVNVTQLIVIDYYYHVVIMLSCTGTLTKKKRGEQGGRLMNRKYYRIRVSGLRAKTQARDHLDIRNYCTFNVHHTLMLMYAYISINDEGKE